jgi:hypothetical protein
MGAEVTNSEKHFSLQWYEIIYSRKKLYHTGPMPLSFPVSRFEASKLIKIEIFNLLSFETLKFATRF